LGVTAAVVDFDFAMFVRAPLKLSNNHQPHPHPNLTPLRGRAGRGSAVLTTWFHDEAGDTGIVDNIS
jgi:hypothetical protein